MSRAAAAVAAAGAIALLLGACETTQQRSAAIARQLRHQNAFTAITGLGAANHDVRISRAVLLTAGGQSAVALALTNTSATAQVALPVLVAVLDARGRTIYRNDTRGIEPSLQQLALLGAHQTAWWVDNEVLAGGVPTRVSGELGAATAAAPTRLPAITTSGVSASNDFPGPHVSVTVTNHSALAQAELPVYAVALHGATVVGAGRAIVASLAPGASTPVLIPMIGSVSAATVALTVPATAVR